jgi:uncharacterized coiled-coil protein SlyX
MAVYKVPQDVEADDKLIGPFTFRQFIFVLILAGFLYFAYLMFTISFILVIIPMPFIVFFAALAFPWRKDQPTEVYLTALIHFWIKPRKRIWNQEGHLEHVKINAPIKLKHVYSDGMSNTEVRSRLHSLASTLDTRGWASKNVSIPDAAGLAIQDSPSDRLVMPMVAQAVQSPQTTITAQDDVMDEINNPVAQNFDTLVNKSTEDHRAQLIRQMQQSATQAQASQQDPDPVAPGYNPYPADMQQSVVRPQNNDHQVGQNTQAQPQNQPVNTDAQSAIINLANNSDLNVSTIARQAEQAMHSGDTIELH